MQAVEGVSRRRQLCVTLPSLCLTLVACNRDPLPSAREMACSSMCSAITCLEPSLDQDEVARCESYCDAKFEHSVEQGEACEDAFEAGMLCLSELSCGEYEVWVSDQPGAPCPAARSEVEDVCEGLYLEAHILPP